ncbi:alpha/beta hydrolase [Streptomyces sp. tea 10]|nr:alpha/beta hydrolase [Streptomyces sp. tea 10]
MVHFRGGMDHWDPAVTDGLAANREVILFDYAGVAGSSGEVPETFEAFGDDSAAVIRALGISRADVLGFSIGAYIAQTLTLRHPNSCAGSCWLARDRGQVNSRARTQRSMRWAGTIRRLPTMVSCSCSSSRLRPASRPAGTSWRGATSAPPTSSRGARCRLPKPRSGPWPNGASRLVSGGAS